MTLALALGGCTAAPAPDNANDGVVRIVASTNVYGDIAASVADVDGANVEITSVIDSPDQDPHEFQANGRVQLALSQADIVIENGGGYDDFIDTMLSASGNDDAIVINAVEVSELDADAEGFNEHVWYDLSTVIAVGTELAGALGEVDDDRATEYAATAAEFANEVQTVLASAVEARASIAGSSAIVTEPVPGYLLDRIEVTDITPPEFSEAIEEDTDVPPALLQSVLNLIGDGSAAIVVYNAQTGGPQTDAVLDIAGEFQVPAVAVTETLPEGLNYVEWQQRLQDLIVESLQNR
jgi:zinc/manganese transport system substrate-binding protein